MPVCRNIALVCKLRRFQYKILWGMVVEIINTHISLFSFFLPGSQPYIVMVKTITLW